MADSRHKALWGSLARRRDDHDPGDEDDHDVLRAPPLVDDAARARISARARHPNSFVARTVDKATQNVLRGYRAVMGPFK